ncbi:mRNA splicing protein [Pichia kluyveri]|uniref:mRNA splicing protein n=1 Tax=Pichia kluyveri TaxID=36015 RepID=A0AAV5R3F2_PICKL|nr:mRNA splicing protein [Pichia kluyveri]
MIEKRLNDQVETEGENSSKRLKIEDEFDDLDDTVKYDNIESSSKYTDKDTYLDTINRKILNFDLPRECATSIATTNIHICLVCNKYLQGSSINSPAYAHSIDANHHVFINTENGKFIVLPEQLTLSPNKEKELIDIKLALNPELDTELIEKFDTEPLTSQTLNKEIYNVGFVPIIDDIIVKDGTSKDNIDESTIKMTSHNAIYYSIAHLPPIRNYLINHKSSDTTPLTNQLSLLTKKIWSPYLFKKFTSSYAIENLVVSYNLPTQISSNLRLFYNWLINKLLSENKVLKNYFTGKLVMKDVDKENKFVNISIKLPQQSIFKDSMSTSIEQYDLMKLIRDKSINIRKYPKILVIYIDRTNDLMIKGINQKLNLNIVKYDPELLQFGENEKYRLISNITYENKVHVFDNARKIWVEINGKSVKEVEKDLLFISNCKLQFWIKQ